MSSAMWRFMLLLVLVAVVLAKKTKEVDPKECEVCVHNLEQIDKLIPSDKKADKAAIEKAITTHCTLSGFGSEWKPNPALTSPKDVKMCYIFEPIKKAISTPFSMGMPKKKVCERLKKDNPEVCQVKYPIKVEKKEGETIDYNKMKIKELKQLLKERDISCVGCTEKADYVKKAQESERDL
eukprot:gene25030-30234_t